MTGPEHDDALAELLRRTMRDEADGVTPAGDGLSRIRTKAAARRRRMLWLRPAVALGSAAAVAAVSFGAYALVNDSGGTDSIQVPPVNTSPPTPHHPTLPPTPSATATQAPPQLTHFPKLAIYPFTDRSLANAWEQRFRRQGSAPWQADPRLVARSWVQSVGVTDVDTVVSTNVAADNTTADVTLGRVMAVEQKRTVAVTVVHLAHYRDAWIVTGASDPQTLLELDAPIPGASVTSPLTIAGPGFGVEESVQLSLRATSASASDRPLGTATTMFGNGVRQWSVSMSYSAPQPEPGVIVGVEKSMADGGTSHLIAERVDVQPSAAATPPSYFYGIKDDRVTKFSTRNGASLSYLTAPQPGGGLSDPQLNPSGDLVYYLQGNGTCSNALMSIHTDGSDKGQGSMVAPPRSNFVISGYGISPDGTEAVMWESSCNAGGKLILRNLHTGSEKVLDKYRSSPPLVLGDPVFAPDAQSVYAFLREGNFGAVQRYGVGGRGPTPACTGEQQSPSAVIDVGSDGLLYIAQQSGNGIDVIECGAGSSQPTTVESLHSRGAASDIDVAGSGDILVADSSGHVWRGSIQLHPSQPLTWATW